MSVVAMEVQGAPVHGYLAVPDSGSGPGVLVIQEWWGLVPHIRSVVERLAESGFVAMAVDHYRGVETTEPDEAQKLMMGMHVDAVAADLAAGANYLLSRKEVTSDSVGSIGFCMGGGLSLLAPTVGAISSAVAFYPAMPWPDYDPDWTHYAGKAAIIHKAESDEGHAGPRISEYAEAIRAAGGEVSILNYPGSEHAFFNDDRPEVYHAEYAQEAWQRSIDFFDARLR
ncbi:MAG TPA: dienelactone hydrolase family protein [Candidatus Nanopelagicales bacterium]|nr:dienelactone hydrolase family protein [Candidatus Nanopelagicales bacterium]